MNLLVDDVTFGYRHRPPVVEGMNLLVSSAEQVALIGSSGAGKTTLFRLLTRTLRPDHGRIVVGGRDIGALVGRELRSTRATIGVIHQRGDLVPSVSALVNVAMATEAAGPLTALRLAVSRPRRSAMGRCRAALDRLDVGHLAEARVDQLSGGQRQRVAVARLLVQAPQVVLADEPTASVDQRSADLIIEALIGLASSGTTLVVATHDLAIARRIDRVVALADGLVVHDGPASRLEPALIRSVYGVDSPEAVFPSRDEPSFP